MEEHRARELLVRECDCLDWFEVGDSEELLQCAHIGDSRVAIVKAANFHVCRDMNDCCGPDGPYRDFESAAKAFARAQESMRGS